MSLIGGRMYYMNHSGENKTNIDLCGCNYFNISANAFHISTIWLFMTGENKYAFQDVTFLENAQKYVR